MENKQTITQSAIKSIITVGAIASAGFAIIAALSAFFKIKSNTFIIYAGIVVGIISVGAVASEFRSLARRRSLDARINDDVITGEETDEVLRVKEYRNKRDEAEEELGYYLPANPRGAKRLINHERLYVLIAEDRQIFGGEPELTYRHLTKWVLIVEHWPRLGAALTRAPDKIVTLEGCTDVKNLQEELNLIDSNIRATAELLHVLSEAIPLSPILGRLVRFEPSASSVKGTTSHALEPAALVTDPTEQSRESFET